MAKILAFSYGIACIILVAIVERLGAILQLSLSVFGVIGGPILGTFVLGIFFPWANIKGAISGLISGLVIVFWIAVGAFLNKSPKNFAPVSAKGCQDLYLNITGTAWNATTSLQQLTTNKDDIFILYRLSYMWYSAIGCLWVVIIGLSISFLSGAYSVEDIKEDLISPLTRKAIVLFSKVKHNKSVFPVEMASNNIRTMANIKLDNSQKPTQDGIINVAYISDSTVATLSKSSRTVSSIHAAKM